MLRSSLIYLSKAPWARRAVSHWAFARRAASRFVAGETLEEAISAVRQLNQKGINATLDHLGEHTNTPDAARRATKDILEIMDGIDGSGVRSNVSIKLTQIGLALDSTLCAENLAHILDRAQQRSTYVRVDMEDSPWVDATMNLYRQMRFDLGFSNLGLVIQAYLFRSEQDILRLREECTGVRLCKGAYKEPSEVAFPRKSDVDANYDRLARLLLDGSKAHGCPNQRWNSRCCMASAAICKTVWRPKATRCGCMCRMARSGTLISPADWQSARQMCGFSSPTW